MKLRIRGNSIRLRLGRSEVRRLATEGIIEEFTQFGPGSQRFRYTVHATFLEPSVVARFADGWLVVRIPATELHEWAHGDQVGIYAMQPTEQGELAVVIEKDFVCIDGDSGESQEDAFPNPALGAGTRSC